MTDVTTPTPGRLLEGTEGDVVSPRVLPGCQAVVLACTDVRFVEPLRGFLGSLGLAGDYDLVCWPGGALALTTPDRTAVLDAVALACDRDQPSELVLVVHHDCDGVGGSASFPGRQAETTTLNIALALAAESATDRFPQLRVRLAQLDLETPCAVIDTHPAHDSPAGSQPGLAQDGTPVSPNTLKTAVLLPHRARARRCPGST